MNRIDELIIEGNLLHDNLVKEKNIDINKWLSESLLYVEEKFPKTEFTRHFISDIDLFRTQWISYEIIDKETFERLLAHLNAIMKHQITIEKEKQEKNEDIMSALGKMK